VDEKPRRFERGCCTNDDYQDRNPGAGNADAAMQISTPKLNERCLRDK
jgi:hypothetical protein